jgi:catechol 2,3-dioxygenase-like lactoylglutathione lyase family enzyme
VAEKARLVGINHVALEVGDVDEALALYGRLFEFELRGRVPNMAFVDMGDQFLALAAHEEREPDAKRHFGLVVDDLEAARDAVEREGLEIVGSRGLTFLDPWGNQFQVVDYREIQFERAEGVKRRLGIEDLPKSEAALAEIAEKGLAGED